MSAPTLSPATQRILDAFVAVRDRKGHAPSNAEVADEAGLSARSTVRYHLLRLERAGYVRLPARGQPRGVVLVKGKRRREN